jgi:2-polyprenyl-3-methyl-5-hydroxy-6-metoxy-1,4-benzoquinol methylase
MSYKQLVIPPDVLERSAKTALHRKAPSFPVRFLFSRGFIRSSDSVLDYGCGHGEDVRWLNKEHSCLSWGYDPGRKNPGSRCSRFVAPEEQFDVVLCTYVLNTLPVDYESEIIEQLKRHCFMNGRIFVTVRNDVKKETATQRIVKLPAEVAGILHKDSKRIIYSLIR